MHFKAIAVSRKQFETWLRKAKQSPDKLDQARYEKLREPSIGHPVRCFSRVKPHLFDSIVGRYMGWMGDINKMDKNPNRIARESGSTQKETSVFEGN
jgi:nitrate reductase alpha subunit